MNDLTTVIYSLLLCATFWCCSEVHSQHTKLPFVHPLFSDDMVLQRDKPISIWGWTKAGETVSVEVNGQTRSARADHDGRWQTTIGPFPAGGPHTLTVRGKKTIELTDVLVGDVWICSGQSNMQWSVAASNDAENEIANANHPRLRLFKTPMRIALEPQSTVDASWMKCQPETIAQFSAVGYYFGRDLQEEIDVPIGLIQSAWGGTVAEAWTSAGSLKSMGDFDEALANFEEAREQTISGKSQMPKSVMRWVNKNDPAPKANAWRKNAFDDTQWQSMTLPGRWEESTSSLSAYDGTVWFRKTFTMPSDWQSEKATLHLAAVDDADVTWVNGKLVGATNGWNDRRKYQVGSHLQAGENTVTVLAYDQHGGGGIHGNADALKIQTQSGKVVSLAGDWRYRKGRPIGELKRFPPSGIGTNPNVVTVLNNGMLAPLTPFGIRGATWYQGESNAGRPEQYGRLLPTMIRDWRQQFDQGDFPFLIVQLANYMKIQESPSQSGWADLREAQRATAASDPQVGLAVITDIGEANDIHPRNKQDVGRRLARQALQIAYGRDIVAAGPTAKSFEVSDHSIHVSFDEIGTGLQAHGDSLNGFAIAAADGDFVWATAVIKGDKVVCSSDEIEKPMRLRYNWANNPIGNLFNSEGLPAGPFKWNQSTD